MNTSTNDEAPAEELPLDLPTEPQPKAVVSLMIEPKQVELQIGSQLEIKNQAFVVQAELEDGEVIDITKEANYSLSDASLGSIASGVFSPFSQAGAAILTVSYEGQSVVASILVTLYQEVVVPGEVGLPEAATAVLDEGERPPEDQTKTKPVIVYPFENTMFPPNLGALEIHFLPGDSSVFKISIEATSLQFTFFSRCEVLEEGCQLTLDKEYLDKIAETTAGKSSLQLRIEGTDETGSFWSQSDALSFSMAPEAVEGGLYYWETSNRAVRRVSFGTKSEPETVLDSRQGCVGCHALAPNGKRMSSSVGGQGQGWLQLLNLETQTTIVGPDVKLKAQFQSWSPDSAKFVGVWSLVDAGQGYRDLTIFDGETASILETITLTDDGGNNFHPSHPDWSPAGDRIAFTKVTRLYSSQRFERGGIAYVKKEEGQWSGTIHELVPPADGINYYTPAYAPTGEFLLYAKSECGGKVDASINSSAHPCNADTDPSSQIWAIRRDGGESILLRNLNRADEEAELANTFPKWSPFVDAQTARGKGRLMWMTFSSIRRAGLHKQGRAGTNGPVNQLLWMAAIDPDAILRGEDGSYAPFALPFQDFGTSNHMGQWTQKIVKSEPEPTCKKVAEECSSSNPCCAELACVRMTESYAECVEKTEREPPPREFTY